MNDKPIAVVACYAPSGIRTTAVTCYNAEAILYAVEHANPADSVHVRLPQTFPIDNYERRVWPVKLR